MNGRTDEQPSVDGVETEADRRHGGRIRQGMLVSNIGTVTDLSPRGMGVIASRPRKGEIDVIVDSETMGEPILVRAHVRWCRKLGFRRFQIGLEFVDVSDALRQRLTRMDSIG
jgi:hypothetical protein